MPLYFFTVPALNPQPAQEELNRFCAGQRVVAIDRQFVEAGVNSFWSLCVSVAAGPGRLPDALKAPEARGRRGRESGTERLDYKEILSEADFALYAELRNWRKTVAQADGVALYQVFTNEQLAAIVQGRVDSLQGLGEIPGIGQSRLERYGEAVLGKLRALLEGAPDPDQPGDGP